ncbi:hypothetical protein A3I56_00385 [Candidatus Roizmanbacteria bacterium RIFCSPLOWO2_02_FULL_43_10]|uniref:Uncharacterized protein n=3 Tax=Candidatus Roizmaniibacteriota TaxID=1752723 RepID=A0A1F7K1N2_9BACT|nr:MAG: hypothetical protein A3D08_00280 [Candidatus Roizmanbacteria bacterium RIFCSPHIGHO2_02_FULL_43_11]OGK37939.1 MAG: hypothetical protein A3F32_02130 [Candidatus Roizmanbacteria bacterium RIFCSPHIGHO2_12_FULL_42_10]OGK61771.1 MAG: hypothetical protein A3I56_00385 [Candidatus Roizmanbacteria bacterium RIFCSPLOWO2_02_FULL_43_10]
MGESDTNEGSGHYQFEVRDGGNLIAIQLKGNDSDQDSQLWADIAAQLNGGSKFDRERFLRDAVEDMQIGTEIRPGGAFAMRVNTRRGPDGPIRELWIQARNNYGDPEAIKRSKML